MNVRIFPVDAMECTCAQPQFIFSSKNFGGMELELIISKGKILSTRTILLRGPKPQCCIKQDSEPNTLPTSYSGPMISVFNTQPTRTVISRRGSSGKGRGKRGHSILCSPTSKCKEVSGTHDSFLHRKNKSEGKEDGEKKRNGVKGNSEPRPEFSCSHVPKKILEPRISFFLFLLSWHTNIIFKPLD